MLSFFEHRNLLTLKLNYSALNCLQTSLCLTLPGIASHAGVFRGAPLKTPAWEAMPGTALVAFTYRVFLHDITVFQNNETAAMLVFQ